MFINSSPNSDSKQCSESKLCQVHNMHTHGPGCTHATRWAGRVAPCHGLARPCRGLAPAHIVASPRSCRSAYRLCRRPCCALSLTLSHAQGRAVSQRLPGCVAGPLGRVVGPLGRVVDSLRPYRRAVSWPVSRHTQQPGHAQR